MAQATRSPRVAKIRVCGELLLMSPGLAMYPEFWKLQSISWGLLEGRPLVPSVIKYLGECVDKILMRKPYIFSLVRLENILSQFGFFHLAFRVKTEFWTRGIALAERNLGSPEHLAMAVFGHIWFGDVQGALAWARRMTQTTGFSGERDEYSEMLWYVSIWSGESIEVQESTASEAPSELRDLIAGKSVMVMGPGVRGNTVEECDYRFVTAVNGLWNVLVEEVRDDSGLNQVLYWTPETVQRTEKNLTHEQIAFLHQFPLNVQLNRWCSGVQKSVRGSTNLVVPWGLGHKAQVMVLDALKAGAKSVFVTGVDFYTGTKMYRNTISRSWLPDSMRGGRQNVTSGWDFKQAYIHALHDGVTNRRILVNLVHSGLVEGDEIFEAACNLSDEEYLQRLECSYGGTSSM